MAYEVGASLSVRNNQHLTPLTLSAKLARIEMFSHILNIEREIYWQIGSITCAAYPLSQVDTIDVNTGKISNNSALNLVVFGVRFQYHKLYILLFWGLNSLGIKSTLPDKVFFTILKLIKIVNINRRTTYLINNIVTNVWKKFTPWLRWDSNPGFSIAFSYFSATLVASTLDRQLRNLGSSPSVVATWCFSQICNTIIFRWFAD